MVYGFPAIICLVFYVSLLLIQLQTLCQSSKCSLLVFSSTKKVEGQFHLLEDSFFSVIELLQWDELICPLFQMHTGTSLLN